MFVHLHTHTVYSILDGIIKLDSLCTRVKELNMPAIAITDHGNLHGAIEFYKAAKKAEIKPIIGCLLSGQEIITIEGVKNIEDIKIGDFVLTHKGRFRPVTKTFSRPYTGKLYKIQLADRARPLYLTEEHPILVTKRKETNRWDQKKFEEAKWLKPFEIDFGRVSTHKGIAGWKSYVSLPKLESYHSPTIYLGNLLKPYGFTVLEDGRIKREKQSKYDSEKFWHFPTSLDLDEDLARFIGLYAAEGSVAHRNKDLSGQIIFTFNIAETEYSQFVLNVLEKKFDLKGQLYIREDNNTREVVVCNVPLAYFLFNCCSAGAVNKTVPKWIFNAPKNVRKAFCQGVLQGDGKKNSGVLKVASKNLAWGMRTLMADFGYWGSITEGFDRNHSNQYFMLNLKIDRKYSRSIELEDRLLKPIKEVSFQYVDTTVYNIEVEEDNSYVSDFILHNCEVYVTVDPDGMQKGKDDFTRDNHHLVLLAQNEIGLKNLFWMISNANLRNFYYKPRININTLATYSNGLIATSACLGGLVAKRLLYTPECKTVSDPEGNAESIAKYLQTTFPGRFYLELQDHEGSWEQDKYNEYLLELGQRLEIPFIITTDAHYLNREDYETHQFIMAQQFKKTLEEYKADDKMHYGSDFYLRSSAEMKALAEKWNCLQAYDNTLKIAEQCNVEIELGKYKMPNFDVTQTKDYQDFLKWKKTK